jgi:hypothetical protein
VTPRLPASFSLGPVGMASAFLAQPVTGADAAFDVVFGAFVVAVVVLSVITLRWALRRDRAGRAQWLRRRREELGGGARGPAPNTNGRKPGGAGSGAPEGPR